MNNNQGYGYNLDKKRIEELRTQQVTQYFDTVPKLTYNVIRSYTEYDMETFKDQCDHIDIDTLYNDTPYNIDVKASRHDLINYVIMELQRRRDHNFNPGNVRRGWIEGNGRLPLEQQIIMQVSKYQMIYYNKRDAYRLINNHKEFFNPENIPWTKDEGNKPDDLISGNILWKRNKYMFFTQNKGYDNSFQFKLLRELNAKKLHLINGVLVPVDILALHPLQYGYNNK